MNVARKIPLMIQNDWKVDYSKHLGMEIAGKSAGVVGLGNIGKRVAEITSAMGMDVKYWSKSSRDEKYEYLELEELFKSCDIIFVTVASNSETEKLITDDMLKSMKEKSIFISITHKVYNHELLNELTTSGKIFGYGNEENDEKIPEMSGNIWTGLPFVWYTEQSLERNREIIISNFENFLKGDLSGALKNN